MDDTAPETVARNELREAFARDGVVLLRGALDPVALREALAAWDWSLAHPGPGASRITQKQISTFYQDLYNPRVLEGYADMLRASPLPDLIAEVWGSPEVWFMYEQVFLKEGGETRRTPWHQDSSYLTVAGDDLAVAWITFEATEAAESLEFVPGSHRGPLYNTSRFDPDDDTAPILDDGVLPPLPDIERRRDAFEVVSFAVEPGDVVLFHPKMLQGGAPTRPGRRRRTLTLRFFGADVVYEPRPGRIAGPRVPGLHAALKPGEPFRHPDFLKLAG